MTSQTLCGTSADSTAVDQVPRLAILSSGTVQRTALPANVHVSWYLVVMVSTPFGRDCWQRKRKELCDPLECLFTNVPSDKTCIRFLGQLKHDLCTPAVNLMSSLAVYATRRALFCFCQSTLDRGHSFTVAQLPRRVPKSARLRQFIVCQS